MIRDAKKIFQAGALLIFFILIVIYGVFGSHNLISGVKIKNVNIVNGEKVASAILEVKGVAKNATNLTLDGREISIDETGNFDETIALLPGYNIINIKARDKFGYSDEKNYKIMYMK